MFDKIREYINAHGKKRILSFVIGIAILASLALTVIIAQNQQTIRQRAAEPESPYTTVPLSESDISNIVSKNKERLQQLGGDAGSTYVPDSCPVIPVKETMEKPDPKIAETASQFLSQATSGLTDALRAYPSASGDNKPQLETQIKQFSVKRKPMLMDLMKQNPDAALQYILSSKENISNFPTNCIEEASTVEGELEILHADFFEDKVSVNQYTLITQDKKRIRLYPAKRKGKLFISGMKIKVNGYRLDDNVIFDESDPKALKALPKSKSSSIFIDQAFAGHSDYHAQIQQEARGEQKTAFILLAENAVDEQTIKSLMTGADLLKITNEFFKENSYGKAWITGAIFPIEGWYRYEPASLGCSKAGNLNNFAKLAMQRSYDQDRVDFSKYDRLIIWCYTNDLLNPESTLGKISIDLPDGQNVKLSIAKIGRTRDLNHEFGHSFGLHHAQSFNICRLVSPNDMCSINEYGDSFSAMGSVLDNLTKHFNAPHKEYLGWFSEEQIRTLSENTEVSIQPIESSGNGLKTVKIPRINSLPEGSGNFLYIEYRQPIGFDIIEEDSSVQQNIRPYNIPGGIFTGALLHTNSPETYPYSMLMNPDLRSVNVVSPWRPSISSGSSFVDYQGGITIDVLEADATRMKLRVHINSIGDITADSFKDTVGNNPIGLIGVARLSMQGLNSLVNPLSYVPALFRFDFANDGTWETKNMFLHPSVSGAIKELEIPIDNVWRWISNRNTRHEVDKEWKDVAYINEKATKIAVALWVTESNEPIDLRGAQENFQVIFKPKIGNYGIVFEQENCKRSHDPVWHLSYIAGGCIVRDVGTSFSYVKIEDYPSEFDKGFFSTGNEVSNCNLRYDSSKKIVQMKDTDEWWYGCGIAVFEYVPLKHDEVYRVEMCLDPNNLISENDEANNCLSKVFIHTVSPTPTPTKTPISTPTLSANLCTVCSADLNKDGSVNISDLKLSSSCLGRPASGTCANADINKDGKIDVLDTSCVGKHFGKRCILPTPTPAPNLPAPNACTACSADINKSGVINVQDIAIVNTCIRRKSLSGACTNADAYKDKKINASDLNCVIRNYLKRCP